jgi:hypothetical protein
MVDMAAHQILDLAPVRLLNGEKQPASSGCSRCDECGGMHRVIIFFSAPDVLGQVSAWKEVLLSIAYIIPHDRLMKLEVL